MKKRLFNILKGLLLFGVISNTLYVASVSAKNLARKRYLEEKYKCCETVPEYYDRLVNVKYGWTIIDAIKNFRKANWYMDKI